MTMSKNEQSTIHFVLMGKGGVGKSLTSTFLAQYLQKFGPVYCADTDPNNQTFCRYEAIGAQHINISTPEMNIDKSKFDELMENLIAHEGSA